MTASERLRELKKDGSMDGITQLYSALPLIADVVEAAEWAMHTDVWIDDNPQHGPTLTAGGGTTKTQVWDNLQAALTALRDALEGK